MFQRLRNAWFQRLMYGLFTSLLGINIAVISQAWIFTEGFVYAEMLFRPTEQIPIQCPSGPGVFDCSIANVRITDAVLDTCIKTLKAQKAEVQPTPASPPDSARENDSLSAKEYGAELRTWCPGRAITMYWAHDVPFDPHDFEQGKMPFHMEERVEWLNGCRFDLLEGWCEVPVEETLVCML